MCPIEWIESEVKKSEYAYSKNIPTPQCHGIAEYANRKGIIYERIYGKTMLNYMMSVPWKINKYSKLLAQLHKDLQKADGSTLPSLKKHLNDSISTSTILNEKQKGKIIEILSALEDGTSLCHYDFHPDQIIITKDGPYIIDWMTAFQGNPLADVARTSIIYNFGYPPNTKDIIKPLIDVLRNQILRNYLNEYLSDKDTEVKGKIKLWTIPVAAARLNENIPGLNDYLLRYIDKMIEGKEDD
jgi:uncharacterized protein (TIGR02172 family)